MRAKTHRRNYARTRYAVGTIASERIGTLVSQAREKAGRDSRLAARYVELARKISMRTKVRIPPVEKRYLCKKCGQPLVPGRNARVRLLPGNRRIIITCLSCGAFKRYPFRKPRGTLVASMKPYITQGSPSPKNFKPARVVQ